MSMIYLPVSLILFLLLLLLFPFIWFAITLDALEIAAAKLGFSPDVALLLLAASILGSTINIPIYEVESEVPVASSITEMWLRQFWGIPLRKIEQKTVVALNVGGGLIPIVLALYQLRQASFVKIAVVTAIVTLVCYFASNVVPGIGISMNPLLPPVTASLCAILLTEASAEAPPIAFAGGVLGTLIGADLLNLRAIQRMSPGVLSIGGAGVFDGIALCGFFALLLS
nr:DUF1614 domain-containing protein [Geitlerinema sp. PCC 9228]